MEDRNWQSVLSAYRDRRDAAKATDPEFDGWLDRVMSVEDIDDDCLPRLHGQLLAIGFLKFQLAGRSEGVRYQITTEGMRALDGWTAEPSDEEPEEADCPV